jgi:hypothetical protein
MRWLLWRHNILGRAKRGELTILIERDTHPSRTAANEPFCTKTQQLSVLDTTGHEVARLHQYLRTDGTIGASGFPDPKRLEVRQQLYRLHKDDASIGWYEKAESFVLKYLLRVCHWTDRKRGIYPVFLIA